MSDTRPLSPEEEALLRENVQQRLDHRGHGRSMISAVNAARLLATLDAERAAGVRVTPEPTANTPWQREVEPPPTCSRCSRSIGRLGDLYRCAQCHAALHLACIKKHFGWSVNPHPHAEDREWMTAEEAATVSDRHFPFIKFQPSGLPYLACLCRWDDRGDTGWGAHIEVALDALRAALGDQPTPEATPDALRAFERYAIEAILDRPFADPDDNAAIAARAALRLAARPAARPAAHQPGDVHRYGVACEVCGEPGYLHVSWDPATFTPPGCSVCGETEAHSVPDHTYTPGVALTPTGDAPESGR